MTELILYDIARKTPENTAWSPLTWRTRLALNLKGLKYRTEWVDFVDIEPLLKKLGAPPGSFKADGTLNYTLPVIYNPATSTYVAHSSKIADYLDETFPDTPQLYPPGTRGLQAAFRSAFTSGVTGPLDSPMSTLTALATCLSFDNQSAALFRKVKEAYFGLKLEEIAPEGSESREAKVQSMEKFLVRTGSWYAANGTPFVSGDVPIQVDIIVAGNLLSIRQILGADSKEWARVMAADGGRWALFMQALEKYTQVV